ncbi:MAG TPA: transglycosylase domain-containing protein [Flavobacteriaceae bacterium]|nr:transglycosylase domain-containing protein [Flavobacteriaceae bacterium]MCB9212029.1 transglycosylase domain-containing protein [Alteromonas sp.]HPF09876.1 transglycosylase domain-containing protein [Flavobacteriaceae bacterium]HQU19973.1 transglycosylase domain-containing protein [Flavobacteriaceae bacterium]HQU64041.1 transglycosylase domain-containing protein [Flavobacteriaceae bacterium]
MANKTKQTKQETSDLKRHIKTFWKLFAGFVLLVLLIFLLASWGIFGKLPDETSLENPEKDLATQIISSDGQVIGKFFKENRTPIQYEDLPEHLVNALIATEDARFKEHSGIDGKGTLRAFVFLGSRGGASTISQQLAKQFFTEKVAQSKLERALQKVKEMIIATRLERRYTKEEIITMYFNVYDFLNLAIGIESAANIYFDKPPQELKIEESAMLVGMFKNSSLYNPKRNPEGVMNRRNVVLSQMEKYGFISAAQQDSLQQLPLGVKFTPQNHDEGIGTYVREYIRGYMKQWAKDNPKPDGSIYDINSDGLKIYTSLDSKMQKFAEEAIDAHMANLQKEFSLQNEKNKTAPFRDITEEEERNIMNAAMRRSDRWRELKKQGKSEKEIIESFDKKTQMTIFSWGGSIDTLMTPKDSIRYYKSFLRASMMSMTPQTGEIKAWVGGIDYKHFKYDMVKTGERQIGSTFKPFVYATAIDQMHMSPCDTLPNTPFCIPAGKYGLLKEWCPKNSDGSYGGMKTLKNALANSINTITARLIDRVGPRPVIDLVEKMGVDASDIPEAPSIALGTADVSLFEMVGAYSTFANEGVYVKPVLVQRIEDKNGTILYQYVPETRDVISKESAYVTISLMQGVTESGSGQRLRHSWASTNAVYKSVVTGYPYEFTNPIAGKTGTTQNNSDGWFMGMVPNLATGVWVGGEDRSTHFSRTAYGQGATMALPIWAIYMRKCYEDSSLDISKNNFSKPQKLSIETDCSKYGEEGGDPEIPDDEFDLNP